MTYTLSRAMSAATAGYSVYAFSDPAHLGRALDASAQDQPGYDLLAQAFGVRDLAVSSFGLLGRSERTVSTAMWIRICCDVGDGILLSRRAEDEQTRTKVLGVTLTWAALNVIALQVDKRRARRGTVIVTA